MAETNLGGLAAGVANNLPGQQPAASVREARAAAAVPGVSQTTSAGAANAATPTQTASPSTSVSFSSEALSRLNAERSNPAQQAQASQIGLGNTGVVGSDNGVGNVSAGEVAGDVAASANSGQQAATVQAAAAGAASVGPTNDPQGSVSTDPTSPSGAVANNGGVAVNADSSTPGNNAEAAAQNPLQTRINDLLGNRGQGSAVAVESVSGPVAAQSTAETGDPLSAQVAATLSAVAQSTSGDATVATQSGRGAEAVAVLQQVAGAGGNQPEPSEAGRLGGDLTGGGTSVRA